MAEFVDMKKERLRSGTTRYRLPPDSTRKTRPLVYHDDAS
jgi:hypothetical protein